MERGSRRSGRAHVGISGYNYPSWRGKFYPQQVRVRDWLRYASGVFNSIELNGTFYSLKSPAVFQRWVEETPPGFVFAVKGSRFITHNLKLARAEGALANFWASGVLALGAKTGPFLWQLPATYRYDRARVEGFLQLLPRNSAEGEALARGHDARLKRGALTEAAEQVSYRHALEVRHPSYFNGELYDLLRAYGCAFVIADTAGRYGFAEEVTADFVYVRLHGSRVLYASGYSDEELADWARRVRTWTAARGSRGGRDVYVYFDNDAWGHAPFDAKKLQSLVAGRTAVASG